MVFKGKNNNNRKGACTYFPHRAKLQFFCGFCGSFGAKCGKGKEIFGRCKVGRSKSRIFFCTIFDRFIKNFHAPASPYLKGGGWRVKIIKKGIGVNFGFSGNNDSDIIPKTSRYHSEGRELVKMSVLKGMGI